MYMYMHIIYPETLKKLIVFVIYEYMWEHVLQFAMAN